MGKRVFAIIICGVIVSGLLTGCDQETAKKLEHIGQNITVISENFSPEKTQELVDNFQAASVVAEELNSEIGQIGAQEVEDETEDAKPYEEPEITEESDEIYSDIDSALILGALMLGSVTEDTGDIDIFKIIYDMAMEYGGKGEEIISEADFMKKSGLEMIYEGLDSYEELFDRVDTGIDEDTVVNTMNGINMVVRGANEIVDGANYVIQESSGWVQDMVDTTKMFGIDTEEIRELEKQLDIVRNMKIKTIKEKTIETIDDLDEDTAEYVEDVLDTAQEVVDRADEATSIAADMYFKANIAAQSVVDAMEEKGVSAREISRVKKSLENSSGIVENMKLISEKDIQRVEKKLDKAMKYTQSFDLGKFIKR